MKSSRFNLPFIMPAQAQKHVTVNEAFRTLDSLIYLEFKAVGLNTPPEDPDHGAQYLIGDQPEGVWQGAAKNIAVWQDGAWAFLSPRRGWIGLNPDNKIIVYDGIIWFEIEANAPAIGEALDSLGVNTQADQINKLSVKSDAVLFSHDDVTPGNGDVRFVVNKASADRSATILFQDDYSARAEIGLSGNDDFTFKVSPDGAVFHDSIIIDKTNGEVSFPNTDLASSSTGGSSTGGSGTPAKFFRRITKDSRMGWTNHFRGAAVIAIGANGNFCMVPILVETVIQTLDIYLQTPASGASLKGALYSVTEDGGIGELLLDFGSVDCSSNGIKTFTAPSSITLEPDMYCVVLVGSNAALRFRGDYFGRADVFSGSGFASSILNTASRGRITFLKYGADFPTDMSNFTVGTGADQIQYLGSWACPNFVMR